MWVGGHPNGKFPVVQNDKIFLEKKVNRGKKGRTAIIQWTLTGQLDR